MTVSCGVVAFKRLDLEDEAERGNMIKVYKIVKVVGKVNAELLLTETLQYLNYGTLDETGWESV